MRKHSFDVGTSSWKGDRKGDITVSQSYDFINLRARHKSDIVINLDCLTTGVETAIEIQDALAKAIELAIKWDAELPKK